MGAACTEYCPSGVTVLHLGQWRSSSQQNQAARSLRSPPLCIWDYPEILPDVVQCNHDRPVSLFLNVSTRIDPLKNVQGISIQRCSVIWFPQFICYHLGWVAVDPSQSMIHSFGLSSQNLLKPTAHPGFLSLKMMWCSLRLSNKSLHCLCHILSSIHSLLHLASHDWRHLCSRTA